MNGKKKAAWGLILAAALLSSVAAKAEVSIGGGISGYMPAARKHVIVLPAAQPGPAAKAAAAAVLAATEAGQPAAVKPAGVEFVSIMKETEKKTVVAQVEKAGKKTGARRGKKRLASVSPAAPKAAAPVSVS